MKRLLKYFLKSFLIGAIALILVAVGIDATDHYDNMSESLVGRLVLGEEAGPCLEDMVFVLSETGGFCADIYEAAAGDACPYVLVSKQSETESNLDKLGCKPVSKPNMMPWRFISQPRAAVACAKAGKRLAERGRMVFASLGTPDSVIVVDKSHC